MKMPLQWYKDNLKNSQASLVRLMSEQARTFSDYEERIQRLSTQNSLRSQQIEEAEKRGLSDFDGDRFMVKRKAKQ